MQKTCNIAFSLLAGAVLSACSGRENSFDGSSLAIDTTGFRNGDLILREGPSAESHAVKLASGAQYSHVGILVRDEGQREWDVVHAVPSEEDPERVKREPLTVFLRTDRALSACSHRVDCPDEVAEAAARYACSKIGTPFDNDYSLSDTTQLYCTELVWQAYRHQGIDVSGGRRHSVGIWGFDNDYIFPVDLLGGAE